MFKYKGISFSGVSTDSRTIKKGELFIALKGPNFDGRRFAKAALKKGASAAIVSNGLKALHDIALAHRKKMKAKVIAITGTSGKTTTKDMLSSVLSLCGATLKTEKNLNNEIGVPLTLLKIRPSHKYAVVELAMQKKGEIRQLARICRPDIAVVTNTGQAHLKQLKTRRNIALAKSEIFEFLQKDSFAIVNKDDDHYPLLRKKAGLSGARIISFGMTASANIRALSPSTKDNKAVFTLCGRGRRINLKLSLPGAHNIYNAMAASAAAIELGIENSKIKQGLAKAAFSGKRLEIVKGRKKTTIINDTYNANPSSMKAALAVLAGLSPAEKGKTFKRIAVLGDMLELGKASKKAHHDIGKLSAALNIDILVAAGKEAKHIYLGAKGSNNSGMSIYYFADKCSAAKKIGELLRPNDIILYKASRGMRLEDIIR